MIINRYFGYIDVENFISIQLYMFKNIALIIVESGEMTKCLVFI